MRPSALLSLLFTKNVCTCFVGTFAVMHAAAIAVPAAVAGAVVALVVSKVFSWIQRRRQRRYEHSSSGSYYEEEETVTGTDSAQDDASAYAD